MDKPMSFWDKYLIPSAAQARWLGRLLMAGVFLWAGVNKLLDPGAFGESLFNYRLLPTPLVWATAWLVPILEIIVAAGLLLPGARRGAWVLSCLLCLGFVVFVFSAWVRGLDISCGCFGKDSQPVGTEAVARALILLSLSLQCAKSEMQAALRAAAGDGT